ncbi:MAG TPA: DUF6249 domain-containing protein [Puia sp.]|nr:DUF6249 domain-containing protein [Puia sp.]
MGPDELVFVWLIFLSLSIGAVIFGIRYMRNRENMAMIEKGLDPNIKPERPRPAPFRSLKWGLLLVGAGLGLFLAYLLDNTLLYRVGHYVSRYGGGDFEVNGANVSVYFALIAIGGGMGLITSYRIEKKELLDKQDKS